MHDGGVEQEGRSTGLARRDFFKHTALVGGLVWASPVIHSFTAPAFAGTPVVGEGCTPGFWKNDVPANIPAWAAVTEATGFNASTKFSEVFNSGVFGDDTLEQVLDLGGGGLNRLGRHAVAAWLNAVSVDYPLSPAEVIARFKAAVEGTTADITAAADEFERFNESDDCPWGADSELLDDEEELQQQSEVEGDQELEQQSEVEGDQDLEQQSEVEGDQELEQQSEVEGDEDLQQQSEVEGDQDLEQQSEGEGGRGRAGNGDRGGGRGAGGEVDDDNE